MYVRPEQMGEDPWARVMWKDVHIVPFCGRNRCADEAICDTPASPRERAITQHRNHSHHNRAE